ncbi:MAG: Trm112 family protein [Candidatus Muiribacteriaceae bacterium]
MIDRKLLDILACPECKGSLRELEDGLLCPECRVIYPVEDGIPIMLSDKTKKYEGDE